MQLHVEVEISSFVTARVGSVLIKLFFACLTCNEDGDLFFCLLFDLCGVLDYRQHIQWPLVPTDTKSPLLLITLK